MLSHIKLVFYFCLFNAIVFKFTQCAFEDECPDCNCDIKCNSGECRECLERVGVEYKESEEPVAESYAAAAPASNSNSDSKSAAPKAAPMAAPAAPLTSGDLTQACLDCMCEKKQCSADEGYYGFDSIFYIHCGRPGGGYYQCLKDRECADGCVKTYMSRFGAYCAGHSPLSCSVVVIPELHLLVMMLINAPQPKVNKMGNFQNKIHQNSKNDNSK
ncbi:hypothetical protein SNEBB_007510 [Seison nebaliae]|nr:hypothetical protein SNEBB_007510 [Seison nebaliae]